MDNELEGKTLYHAPRSTYDSALLRVDTSGRAVYCSEQIIEILIRDMGMDEDEAFDYYCYNIEGAYMGPHTPIYEWMTI